MIEETMKNAESMITKWDTNSSSITKVTSLFQHNKKEAKEFIRIVKDLRQAMHFLVSENSASGKLVLAQKLMQIAMRRLEKEFYEILSANHNQIDPDSVKSRSSDGSGCFDEDDERRNEDESRRAGDSITEVVENVTGPAISDLKSIADCMVGSGYGKECVKIYKFSRKSVVDVGLYQLGIEHYKSSQIHKMNWEELEHMIKNWLNIIRFAVKAIFEGEKILCDHLFSASKTIRDSCFSEITSDGATNLFRFPEFIAKHKKSPDRIFPLMELYEAIFDLWPEIDSIFISESTSAIKSQALSSLHKLGDSIHTILSDFESKIQKDSSKTLVPGGGIHPLTESSMNYISSLTDYGRILSDIVANFSPQKNSPLPESYFESPTSDHGSTTTSALSVHLSWLILVLLCKLDRKAALYKDAALSYLFLANNLQLIIEKVRTSDLKFVLGDEWMLRHDKKIRQFCLNYESMAWNKVFSCIPDRTSPLTSEAAVECFRRFSSAFEEAYKKQTSWFAPNSRLREELKLSIEKKLVPLYREFYDTYWVMVSEERNLDVLAMFQPDDLKNYFSDMFRGTRISGSSLSSSSSSSSLHLHGCLPR
ncbi:Exo70 domain-containing protein [Cephalotus follicularis]|uniref:Exocyst subunit Exo70 family protein n=1 Tax=Cephalotus follicularis TaxID=3775 RepID=A0A1Q3CA15_CEPFO|nr:Exo70 domain-containing protein [Cephalotus follicularis]